MLEILLICVVLGLILAVPLAILIAITQAKAINEARRYFESGDFHDDREFKRITNRLSTIRSHEAAYLYQRLMDAKYPQ